MPRQRRYSIWDEIAWRSGSGAHSGKRTPAALGRRPSLATQFCASMVSNTKLKPTLRSIVMILALAAGVYWAASWVGPRINSNATSGKLMVGVLLILPMSWFLHWSFVFDARRHAIRERRRRTRIVERPDQSNDVSALVEARRAALQDSPSILDVAKIVRRTMGTDPRAVLLSNAGSTGVLLFIVLLSYPGQSPFTWLPLVLISAQFPLGMCAWWLTARRVKRVQASLTQRCCPDCGYSLVGVPPGLPALGERGHAVGPARCPECGSPWPLVPPVLDP